MTPATDCQQNIDPFKLVREGTSQEQRHSPALDPDYAPVNEHNYVHGIVFAQAYSAYLKYYNVDNVAAGDWQPFFSEDAAPQLAIAAVEDVEFYRQTVREYVNFLNDRQNQSDEAGLRDRLDYLFSCCATLAIRLNLLTEKLPAEIPLRKSLQNLIRSQLAPALERLIIYHKSGELITDPQKPINDGSAEKAAPLKILGGDAVKFSKLSTADLSKDWTEGANWTAYYNGIPDVGAAVYGSLTGTSVFDRANHLATHNLFTSILDQFLKVYARTVSDAKQAVEMTLKEWDRHEPHFALFLAFLRLFEYARAEANTLTARHLDLYYREILRLQEKAAEPGKAHLLVELAKQASTQLIKAGELFRAGKDKLGKDAFFANDRDLVVNQAKVAALKTVYRHGGEPVVTATPSDKHQGRLFASPAADSEDGLGTVPIPPEGSWHPFFNKIYQDGSLAEIKMPAGEVGFALASHYLFLAEGERTVTLEMDITGCTAMESFNYNQEVTCLFSSVKGWIEHSPVSFTKTGSKLKLEVKLTGNDPAVTPYNAKVHGYNFATDLPLLLLKIKHTDNQYIYNLFQETGITNIKLTADVTGLRTLAVANDFGPVDTSKPFLPFGPSPRAGSAMVIGSKEVFQKESSAFEVAIKWQVEGTSFSNGKSGMAPPAATATWLKDGSFNDSETITLFSSNDGTSGSGKSEKMMVDKAEAEVFIGSDKFKKKTADDPVLIGFSNFTETIADEPDFSENVFYGTDSRHGFLRLAVNSDFGLSAYQTALRDYLIDQAKPTPAGTDNPGGGPTIPIMESLSLNYVASQNLALNSKSPDAYAHRKGRFFHLGPFGQAEQHPFLSLAASASLFPQFDFQRNNTKQESEAELYIGVTGFKPPQNLALLFQVADGTADPLSEKPEPHIHWSYLRRNEWIPFSKNEVGDLTGELLNSGIVTFAVPREASAANTLLPAGMHWIRAAVASESDAVCRLRLVAAQALAATFTDRGNDPAFPAQVLQSGTINKLDQPQAAVKKISQPFPTFGGRGKEAPAAFYTRTSERLRHKDRAVVLWDYERLVLEAFPQIYRVRCLNHTHYEPDKGTYRELAPGHVTIVTIPNQQFHNLRDPLQPFTSLGLLKEVESFLRRRLSCFVALHVKNPLFEEVRVNFKVRLSAGRDETFHVNKLQEEITRFLSPWAFPGGGNPSFGGKIYKSVLINFVEELPYVDYVSDFKLFQKIEGVPETGDQNEVEASKAVSVLVSVAAKKHVIEPIKPAEDEMSGEKCICEI